MESSLGIATFYGGGPFRVCALCRGGALFQGAPDRFGGAHFRNATHWSKEASFGDALHWLRVSMHGFSYFEVFPDYSKKSRDHLEVEPRSYPADENQML